MPVWVSLLRGINLGSHNQVNLPRLREALAGAGFAEVRTYVQSGNVVTTSGHRSDRVAAAVRDVVREHFRLDVPVVVRYADSLHGSRLQHSVVLRRLGVDGTARNWSSPRPRWSERTRTASTCARSIPRRARPGRNDSCSVPTTTGPASATASSSPGSASTAWNARR